MFLSALAIDQCLTKFLVVFGAAAVWSIFKDGLPGTNGPSAAALVVYHDAIRAAEIVRDAAYAVCGGVWHDGQEIRYLSPLFAFGFHFSF